MGDSISSLILEMFLGIFQTGAFKRIALLLKIEKVPSVHFLKECTYLVYQFLHWIYAPYLFSCQLLK